MIKRDVFFDNIRPMFGGKLEQKQVQGIDFILNEWESRKLTDLRWLAYMLATVKLETAHTMQPVREYGGETYLKKKKYYPWVGEGLVQVTWETNHRKFGATAPGQLLTWPKCLNPLYDGMIKGMFTGKKLSDYFTSKVTDWNGARRIINGTDRADEIATMAKQFHSALLLAFVPKTTTQTAPGPSAAGQPVSVPPPPLPQLPPPEPPPQPMVKSKINWGAAGTMVGAGLTAVNGGLEYATKTAAQAKETAAKATELLGGFSWLGEAFTNPLMLIGVAVVIIGAGGWIIYHRKQLAEEKGV